MQFLGIRKAEASGSKQYLIFKVVNFPMGPFILFVKMTCEALETKFLG